MSRVIHISDGMLSAGILPLGASLQDLRCAPFANPLVLSMPPAQYGGSHAALYSGAVVGRVAGRIAGGQAVLDGVPLSLPCNAPPHHLHGGSGGFAHRTWQVQDADARSVTLTLRSEAREEGYPGSVDVQARYALPGEGVLTLTVEARSDADTLLNICHHPYFNLDGSAAIDAHRLEVPAAARYLPSDDTALPTGEIAKVDGTEFDFRVPRAIGPHAYDHSLCLHDAPAGPLAFAARLVAESGPALEIWTTQPALHIFDGRVTTDVPNAQGGRYGPRAAIALEAQGWPDAPNRSAFPSVRLRAGALYAQTTQYRFFPDQSAGSR